MSRVGKTIIKVPAEVKVEIIYGYPQGQAQSKSASEKTENVGDKRLISVTGPKGVLLQEMRPSVWAEIGNGQIELKRANDEALTKSLHGLYNRLIQNMITGVTKGFTKTLICHGVGYKANMKGENLVLNLGMSHPSEVAAEDGVKFKICNPTEVQALNLGKEAIGVVIQVTGASKEQVGAVASKIRGIRKVEPYHLYGIRYSNEHVVRKESKSGKKAGPAGGAKK